MSSPAVNISAIAALGKASTPSTPTSTSTGRPQLTGPSRAQQQPPRPRKERVVGETPFYRREDRETLWNWMNDVLGWCLTPIVKIFGENAVKTEVLSVWHTDIHRMAELVRDTLVIECIKASFEELEMLRRAAIDRADRMICNFRADMTAAIEYKENGVSVNSMELDDRGMSPRSRLALFSWILEWGPSITEATGEKMIDRRADRRDLQTMFRYVANVLWFARLMAEIKLRLAIRNKNEKAREAANKELDTLQDAPSIFHEQMKRAREADRAEMEANNNPANTAARRRTA
jgi:hypothetical protein